MLCIRGAATAATIAIGLFALPAGAAPSISIAPGVGPLGKYFSLSGTGIPAIAGVGNDTLHHFDTPAFTWAGQSWTSFDVSSDGYVIIGGDGSIANNGSNTNLPDAAAPNNVLAPFWTDLDPTLGGAVYAGIVAVVGGDTYYVVDWDGVPPAGASQFPEFFEIWIRLQLSGSDAEQVVFSYTSNGFLFQPFFTTIGAEDATGTVGATYFYNGTGTLIAPLGDELVVTSSGFGAGENPTDPTDAVPEPATLGILAVSLGALRLLRRRAFPLARG